jgi:Fic family protein
MGALEAFLHDDRPDLPLLVKAGLVHVQFETIHPFLDGNGRLGRLLITFLLCTAGVLREPILYLSLYFKQHRSAYYDLLNGVRTKAIGRHGSTSSLLASGTLLSRPQRPPDASLQSSMITAQDRSLGPSSGVRAAGFRTHAPESDRFNSCRR